MAVNVSGRSINGEPMESPRPAVGELGSLGGTSTCHGD
jgi:hypothetical protein